MTDGPIVPYPQRPLAVREADRRAEDVARRVDALVRERRPDLEVVHIGSTAVEGLPGKGVVDLGIHPAREDVPAVSRLVLDLGFTRTTGAAAFPDSRPLFIGALAHDGDVWPIHLHVIPEPGEWGRQLAFRDALRADPDLRGRYTALKQEIVGSGLGSSLQYSFRKTAFIRGTLEAVGAAEPPIPPGATIGILGGGQLGRMLALAARPMGYRVVVLDPDPACPASAVADDQLVAGYDDVDAAIRLAEQSDVVTFELEHVAADAARAVDNLRPLRPGLFALLSTQNRLAERRFLESIGAPVAPWREVRSRADLDDAIDALRPPLRLKVAVGGYDGRRQVRLAGGRDADAAWEEIRAPAEAMGVVAERELEFRHELSVVVGRDLAGRSRAYPVARNVHDRGILIESDSPAPILTELADRATALAERIATGLDAVGVITVELFAMPDGELLVNELAPRVHNSGHLTIELCRTSQFEQHVRAICGLPLGSAAPRAPAASMMNLLGTGVERPAHPLGAERALADPGVSLHLYGKRRVFERRKMGHVTVTSQTLGDAMRRARAAAAVIEWAE